MELEAIRAYGLWLTLWGYGLVMLVLLSQLLRQQAGAGQGWQLAAMLATMGWSACALQPEDGLLARWNAAHAFDTLRYACWLGYLLQMLHTQRGEGGRRRVQVWAERAGIAGLLALAWGSPSPLYMTVLAVAVLVLTEQFYRNLDDDARWGGKPICLALVGTFAFDFYLHSEATIFRGVDPVSAAARGHIQALLATLLLLAVIRQRRWRPRVQLSRQMAFHTLSLTLAGAYLLFIAGVGYYLRYFGGTWGQVMQVGLVFVGGVGLLALSWSGTLRAKARVWLGKHFLGYRYDYRNEWLRFTRALSACTQPEDLAQHVIRGLADMVESPAGALWMRTAVSANMVQVARWNLAQVNEPEPVDSSLQRFMSETGWVIDLSEYRQHPQHYGGMILPNWMHGIQDAWLLIPLRVGVDHIGFVLLANPRTRWDINWEVLDLLKTAAMQAASVLAQMQAAEALMESRKFESFNRMSAFVVHDLKNIVTQLSLMMKNARRLKDNPEFQEDMLMTVDHALERMKQLMLQLREGGTPAAGAGVGVDLSTLAQHWADSAARRGRTVEVSLQPHVTARGHDERLMRVVGHLIQNALDATESHGGHVQVRTHRYGSHACLVVQDDGVGMTEEFIHSRLFKPFQTTKQAGMGIGAFESAQYVQELGGKLTVESQVGLGSTITLTLPLLDTSVAMDASRSTLT